MRKLPFKFSEKFSIIDLDNNAVSDLTASYLFDREHGGGANVIKLHDAQIRADKLYIHYRSYPTYTVDTVRIATSGAEIPTKYYDTLFEFQDVAANLGDAETFNQFNPAERASVLRDFLEEGMARTWCNCGAYYYQAHWEAMDKLDASIFPFPGPKGTGEWKDKHARGLKQSGISICKHIASAIHHMLKQDINSILKLIKLPEGPKKPEPIAAEKPAVETPVETPIEPVAELPEEKTPAVVAPEVEEDIQEKAQQS